MNFGNLILFLSFGSACASTIEDFEKSNLKKDALLDTNQTSLVEEESDEAVMQFLETENCLQGDTFTSSEKALWKVKGFPKKYANAIKNACTILMKQVAFGGCLTVLALETTQELLRAVFTFQTIYKFFHKVSNPYDGDPVDESFEGHTCYACPFQKFTQANGWDFSQTFYEMVGKIIDLISGREAHLTDVVPYVTQGVPGGRSAYAPCDPHFLEMKYDITMYYMRMPVTFRLSDGRCVVSFNFISAVPTVCRAQAEIWYEMCSDNLFLGSGEAILLDSFMADHMAWIPYDFLTARTLSCDGKCAVVVTDTTTSLFGALLDPAEWPETIEVEYYIKVKKIFDDQMKAQKQAQEVSMQQSSEDQASQLWWDMYNAGLHLGLGATGFGGHSYGYIDARLYRGWWTTGQALNYDQVNDPLSWPLSFLTPEQFTKLESQLGLSRQELWAFVNDGLANFDEQTLAFILATTISKSNLVSTQAPSTTELTDVRQLSTGESDKDFLDDKNGIQEDYKEAKEAIKSLSSKAENEAENVENEAEKAEKAAEHTIQDDLDSINQLLGLDIKTEAKTEAKDSDSDVEAKIEAKDVEAKIEAKDSDTIADSLASYQKKIADRVQKDSAMEAPAAAKTMAKDTETMDAAKIDISKPIY